VNKLESHLVALITGLRNAGVEVLMRFNRLGSTADELIGLLATSYSADNTKKKSIGGEVILHIAKRCVFLLSLKEIHVDEATRLQTNSPIHIARSIDHESISRTNYKRHPLDVSTGRTTQT
jgi:hypothetical protein